MFRDMRSQYLDHRFLLINSKKQFSETPNNSVLQWLLRGNEYLSTYYAQRTHHALLHCAASGVGKGGAVGEVFAHGKRERRGHERGPGEEGGGPRGRAAAGARVQHRQSQRLALAHLPQITNPLACG